MTVPRGYSTVLAEVTQAAVAHEPSPTSNSLRRQPVSSEERKRNARRCGSVGLVGDKKPGLLTMEG